MVKKSLHGTRHKFFVIETFLKNKKQNNNLTYKATRFEDRSRQIMHITMETKLNLREDES